MRALSLSSVSFSYTAANVVLSDVSLELGAGWHGLVGANGSGKTTLLSLISGDLSPSRGTVIGADPIVRCDQVVDAPSGEVLAFATSHDGAAYAMRGRLGLEPEMVERWTTLSPGERRRWQVASALASTPAVLLLDEPTNHLDAESTALLIDALASFEGVGVICSHDRDVLDRLTRSTIRLERGRAEFWAVPYSQARVEWQRAEARRQSERDAATRESRKLARRLDDERRTAELKTAQWKRSQRYARPGDHDTTSARRTARFRSGQAAAGQRITAVRDEAQRAEISRQQLGVNRDHRGAIEFDGEPAPRRVLVGYRGDLEVPGRVLCTDLDVVVERDTRLRISGANGAGKTTLLNLLRQRWDLPQDQLLFLPQDLTPVESEQILVEIVGRSNDDLGRALQLFARLGGEPDAVLASDRPSPGELRKLILADALSRNVWCLMMDEPTNHLDLETVEAVEEALAGFPGSVVVISHDDRFAAAVTDAELALLSQS